MFGEFKVEFGGCQQSLRIDLGLRYVNSCTNQFPTIIQLRGLPLGGYIKTPREVL